MTIHGEIHRKCSFGLFDMKNCYEKKEQILCDKVMCPWIFWKKYCSEEALSGQIFLSHIKLSTMHCATRLEMKREFLPDFVLMAFFEHCA